MQHAQLFEICMFCQILHFAVMMRTDGFGTLPSISSHPYPHFKSICMYRPRHTVFVLQCKVGQTDQYSNTHHRIQGVAFVTANLSLWQSMSLLGHWTTKSDNPLKLCSLKQLL